MPAVVDVGKSGTRLRWDEQRIEGPGLDPASPGRLARALATVLVGAVSRLDARPRRVLVGTTGLPAREHDWLDLAAHLNEELPTTSWLIVEDGILAHAAVLGSPGVVASVGTGTVIYGLDGSGDWHKRDGWGPDLGDRGSAFALGRAAIRLACQHRDGVVDAPAITRLVEEAVGQRLDLAVANDFARAPDRTARLSALARVIAESSDRHARELVAGCARETAATCASLADQISESRVGLVGRLGRADSYRVVMAAELASAGLELATFTGEVLDVDPAVLDSAVYASVGRQIPATRPHPGE